MNPSKKYIFILAALLAIASISRIPLVDQLPEVKISIFGIGVVSGLVLLGITGFQRAVKSLFPLVVLYILFRFILGFVVAKFEFGQSIAASAQEARFGVMLFVLPMAYAFLKNSSIEQQQRLVGYYVFVLLIIDFIVYLYFSMDAMLRLGFRTDNRFVLSALIPLVISANILIRKHISKDRSYWFVVSMVFVMLFHSLLVTTSRVEILISFGLLSWTLIKQFSRIKGLLYAFLAIGTYFTMSSVASVAGIGSDDGGIAGRDYWLALKLAFHGLPLGFGLVVDNISRTILGLPDSFYFSDYGILSYVLRYGIFGIVMSGFLFLLWFRFAYSIRGMSGNLFISIPIFLYLIIIPFLDYGSLGGSFLLAFMIIVAKINKYPRFATG